MSKSKKATATTPLFDLEAIKTASVALKGINHKTRQKMMELIATSKEIKVSDIYAKIKMEQSKASAYLALLRRSGVVSTRRDGQVIYYSINYKALARIKEGVKLINK